MIYGLLNSSMLLLQRKVPKFSNRVTLRERSSATEGSRFVNSKRFFAVAKSAAARNDTPKRQHCAVILVAVSKRKSGY